jgi:hypothetical protein
MKRHLVGTWALAAAALAVCCVIGVPAAAQNASAVQTEAAVAAPRTADGHPDLSGYYDNNPLKGLTTTEKSADGSVSFVLVPTKNGKMQFPPPPPADPSVPSYKPEFAAKLKAITDKTYGHTNSLDPGLHCLPLGIPRVMGGHFQIVQTSGLVVILFESLTGPAFRIIPTNGRPHPKDIDPSFLGDSVGRWEGDTLVVDVIGLNDQTWLGGTDDIQEPPGFPRTKPLPFELIHSDQEHVIERYTRKGDILTYEATVEDPVMFTKPWVITPRHFKIGDPNDRLEELICVDQDAEHVVKPTAEDPSIPGKVF